MERTKIHKFVEHSTPFQRNKLQFQSEPIDDERFERFFSHSAPFSTTVPGLPAIFTEGELKSLALMNTVGLSMLVVGVPGVWAWIQKGRPLWEFGLIEWRGRVVYVIFDSDTATNKKVETARNKLATVLSGLAQQCGP